MHKCAIQHKADVTIAAAPEVMPGHCDVMAIAPRGAPMTITQSSWNTRQSALAVTIKPLRPFIPKPRLSLVSACEDRDFPFEVHDGMMTALVPQEDIARLLHNAGSMHLFLAMRALYQPGTPTRRWQWGVKLAQDGKPLTCYGPRGISVPPDAEGFVRSAVHAFPAHRQHGHDSWDLVLEERAEASGLPWRQSGRDSSRSSESDLCRAR